MVTTAAALSGLFLTPRSTSPSSLPLPPVLSAALGDALQAKALTAKKNTHIYDFLQTLTLTFVPLCHPPAFHPFHSLPPPTVSLFISHAERLKRVDVYVHLRAGQSRLASQYHCRQWKYYKKKRAQIFADYIRSDPQRARRFPRWGI